MSTQSHVEDPTLVRPGDDPLPFRVELSLEPLIAFWEKIASDSDPVRATFGRVVLDALGKAPELRRPIPG
jgi:hypothetical protein